MNKIIPFNKDIVFNEKIGEIESIALDDTLKFTDLYTIKGELIVRGCNKILDMTKEFSYPIPVEIAVDDKYDTKKASISIDDFYYEIINDNILRVKIDLILDDLLYQEEVIEPVNERLDFDVDIKKEKDVLDANASLTKDGKDAFVAKGELFKDGDDKLKASLDLEKKDDKKEDVMDLFKESNDNTKEYSIYRVYTILENDTLDSILKKYNVTKEELEKYNDLSQFKPNDKLIIPSVDE